MKRIKTVHLHSDFKFVSGTSRLEGENFENTVIIITDHKTYEGHYKETAVFIKPNDLKRIVNYCKNADLVVVYGLDLFKSRIVLKLPKTVKIAWRFFGYELYEKRQDLFLSEQTRSIFQNKSKSVNKLKRIYHFIKFGDQPLNLFYRAVDRTDYMMVLSREEYDFLSKYWKNLPEFVQLSFGFGKKSGLQVPALKVKMEKKKQLIVVGNNRLMFNNHLDVINIIDKSPNKAEYQFVLLFNYGREDNYSEAVKEATKGKEYFQLIEDFMPLAEFHLFYQKIGALVINGYREMAVGNIFSALVNGTKIYLNEKNVFITWLRNEGFYVHSMEDFEEDLKNNNLWLEEEKAQKNLDLYTKLSEKYSVQDMQHELYGKMMEANYAAL